MDEIKNKINDFKKVIGLKQVVKHAKKSELREIYIASDVDKHLKERITNIADKHDVPIIITGPMHKLGKVCEIDVKAAVIGIFKES